MRSYGDACGIAHAMDLLGERWAVLVVRELIFGPKRYTDLRQSLPAASPTMVSQRLEELQAAGIVVRRRLGPPAGAWVYELTDWGHRLEPILVALGDWALRSSTFDGGGTLSPVSAALTLRTYFDPSRHPGWAASFDLRFGVDRFAVRISAGQLDVLREEAAAPDAVVDTDPRTFVEMLAGRQSAATASAARQLTVTGDQAAARRLLTSVTFPADRP
jgi:DNA-binding HxlR family transcriptional regulator/putative sterol carrier protein